MLQSLPPYLIYMMALVCGFVLGVFSIPKIIYVAKRKRLLDLPDNHRKLHVRVVPNLGGVGIFFAFIITTSVLIQPAVFTRWTYVAAAAIILFVTGVKDDLVSMSPSKKFLAQAVASFIIAGLADIRLQSLHGVFGIHELPYWFSLLFTVIGCMFVTNAFNLIDGIDGLAGSVGVLASGLLGLLLALEGRTNEALMAFALMGSIAGFLRFNMAPARIFMGDTGSLLIGFTLSVLCVLFINGYNGSNALFSTLVHAPKGTLTMALAIMFVPVFDTFRVFTTRAIKGRSPFTADRTHLHHYLLDLGLSHTKTVSVLITANILIIGVSYLVQDYNFYVSLGCQLMVAFGLFAILFALRHTKYAVTPLDHGSNGQSKTLPINMNQERTPFSGEVKTAPPTLAGKKLKLESAEVQEVSAEKEVASLPH